MDRIFKRLRVRNIPPVPLDVQESFEGGTITPLEFADRSRLLTDRSLISENGLHEFQDGTFLVAVSCHIPDVDRDMVHWWAWWFPGDVERYRAWLPDSNINITYDEADADYFGAESRPPFRPVSLYPEQVVGGMSLPFRIDLMNLEDFGFSAGDLHAAGDPAVYCGNLSVRKGKYLYTSFVYMFFEEGDGVRFCARFWIGRRNGNRLLRIIMLNRRKMEAFGIGCYREYSSLEGFLPELYREYGPGRTDDQ